MKNSEINVGVFAANGRMGKAVIQSVTERQGCQLTQAIVRETSVSHGQDSGLLAGISANQLLTVSEFQADPHDVDVMIDFSLPQGLESHIAWCVKHKKALVIGTTAVDGKTQALIDTAAMHIPIVFAPNMSVGVNLLLNLLRMTTNVIGDDADIEIIEAHHRFKRDAPSGTAMRMGEVIAETLGRDLDSCAIYGREGDTGERDSKTIGFSTIRAGDIIGEHTAIFADLGERIELTHKATNRSTFAKGAVRAALWLKQQPPGLYGMQHVLGF